MNRFDEHVKDLKPGLWKWLGPAHLGMDIKMFNEFADSLIAGAVDGFYGSAPHKETGTGHGYIDMIKVHRVE